MFKVKPYQYALLFGVLLTPFLLDLRFKNEISNTINSKDNIHELLTEVKQFVNSNFGQLGQRERSSNTQNITEMFNAYHYPFIEQGLHFESAYLNNGLIQFSFVVEPSQISCLFKEEIISRNYLILEIPDYTTDCNKIPMKYVLAF